MMFKFAALIFPCSAACFACFRSKLADNIAQVNF